MFFFNLDSQVNEMSNSRDFNPDTKKMPRHAMQPFINHMAIVA
jgi:hypothetical protein